MLFARKFNADNITDKEMEQQLVVAFDLYNVF